MLSGHAKAAIAFRRGIDIDLEAEISGSLDATAGHDLSATLKAGFDVRAAAVIQAQLPLDLFTEAGLIARAQLSLAASAYASLTLSLRMTELESRLREALPGLAGELASILLEEFVLSAGLWVRAGFAAELTAEAVLAVSLFGDSPGLTFSFEGAAGIGASVGVSFMLNAGIVDPDRLVHRLADQVASAIVGLIPTATAEERRAQNAVRVLLPGLLGAAVTVGSQLVDTRTASSAKAKAGGALMSNVLSRALDVMLRAGLDAAFDELHAALVHSTIVADFAMVDDKPAAANAIGHLASALSSLDNAAPGNPHTWVEAVLGVVAAAEGLVMLPGLPGEIGTTVTPALSTIWAAGALVGGILDNSASGASMATSLLNGSPAQDPGPTLRAVFGEDITYRHLATYVAGELERLLEPDPEMAGLLEFIGHLIGAGGSVISTAVELAGKPPAAAALAALDTVLAGAGAALVHDVLPALHRAIGTVDPDADAFVKDFAKPVVTAFAHVIPVLFDHLEDDDARMRAREGLSAVLLSLLGGAVNTLVQIVIDHASSNGGASATDLANQVHSNGGASTAYQNLAAASQGAAIEPATVEKTVQRSGSLLPLIGHDLIQPLIGTITTGITGGVGDETVGGAAARTILTSDDVPDMSPLGDAVSESAARAVAFAGHLLEELFEDIEKAVSAIATTIVHAISEAATAVLGALREGVALAQKEIAQIGAAIDRFERDAEAFLASALTAAADLADRLRRSADQFFNHLLSQIHKVLHESLPDFIADPVYFIVAGILHGLQEVVDLLDDIVSAMARNLAARLRAAATAGQLTPQMFDAHVNAVAYEAPRHDVHLAVPTFWGSIPVTVDAGAASGAALSTTLGSPDYPASRTSAVNAVAQFAQSRSSRNQAVAAYNSATTRAAMQDRVDALQTGQALNVVIEAPTSGPSGVSQLVASIRIIGANLSFVQAQTNFGMPARIQILLNDQLVSAPGAAWSVDGGDLVWRADLVAVEPVYTPPSPRVRSFVRTVPASTGRIVAGGRTSRSEERGEDVTVSVSPRARPRAYHDVAPVFPAPHAVPRAQRALANSTWETSLAVRPGVNTLAVAVADGGGRTAQAHVVFAMTSALRVSADVHVVGVAYDAPDGEYVVLHNSSAQAVHLAGWSLRDIARHRLPLPDVDLDPGSDLRVYTKGGTASAGAVFLGRRRAVWNNSGDTALLIDPAGSVVSAFQYVGAGR